MQQFVNVPVPADRVTEVYALLAEPRGVGNGANELGGWSREDLVRMYEESGTRMKDFLDHLVDHPDQEFTARDMAHILKVRQSQLRGVVGAFGHRVKSRYGWKRWPIDVRWDSAQSTSVYRMSAAMARVIKGAR